MKNVTLIRAGILVAVCGLLAGLMTDGWNRLTQPARQPIHMVVGQPAQMTVPMDAAALAAANAARKNAEEKAAQHAAYLARYLNSGFSRKPGMKTVALAVASEDGRLNLAFNSVISDRFKTDSVNILTSLFRPAFVADGLFNNALNGSDNVLDNLELSKSLDVLLLGQQTVQYSSDPSLENVISANMRFELTALVVGTGQNQSWTYVANGSGFKQTEARAMAEERLIEQIARDAKLSLKF